MKTSKSVAESQHLSHAVCVFTSDPFSPDPFAAEVVDEEDDEQILDSPTADGEGDMQQQGDTEA